MQLFSICLTKYKPRIENIENTQIQQDTLDTINRLVTLWNQDPISQTHDLIITKDQFYTINRNNILYQLPIEESLPPIEDILLPKDIETLTPVTKNSNRINYSEDPEKDYVCQIRNDLLVQS
ncbi:42331_t:CDS:2, partial [Gigaspora margarita]